MDFKLQDLDKLIDLLKDARKSIRENVKAEMYQFAEEVMAESKSIYVPVKTGALMNTGKVFPPVEDLNSVTVEMGYGDESVDYALIVHEEMQSPKGNPINWTRPGSGPKYLQMPFDQKSDELPYRISIAVEKSFKKK